jgi:pyruvate dehydrogenase E2 component (dihydrolipoamide acetyltransferase)
MTKLKPFTMPKWGIEMSEGTIAEWLVAENVPFAKGTILTLIETDKITNEVEAEVEGRFVRIVARAGETYPVGALLAVLADGEAGATEIDLFIGGFKSPAAGFEPDAQEALSVPDEAPPDAIAVSPVARSIAQAAGIALAAVTGSGRGGRISAQDVEQHVADPRAPVLAGPFTLSPAGAIFATPMARRLSALHGVALETLTGSGPRGRIRQSDVLAAVPAPSVASPPALAPAPAPAAPLQPAAVIGASGVDIVSMSSMRRTIARRLTEAKQQIPHFYVRRRVRADRLLALRAAALSQKPSINDYLIRACALALMEIPQLNIQVHGNDIHRFASADIAVAVATERGLVTPIVTAADERSVPDIAAVMAGLVQRAKAGKLKPEEFTGGSFSLSNLGGFGVEQFDAIINPPQGAILAVGTARPEPIDDGGAIRIVPTLHLSLSCDHRAIDGADAGRFMGALARLIESPELLAYPS